MSTPTSPVPIGATAHRLEWRFLPPHVRSLVESRCGSTVVDAVSQNSGFTPGFASVLTCADGSKHFVKAASVKAQRLFADSYREEARKLATLPASVPAPRLLWTYDDDWVVLGIEYVDGRNPSRPWSIADLDACLDTAESVARDLTPPPADLRLDTFAEELADWPGLWNQVRATRSELAHAEEAAALAGRFAEVTGGSTVVHTDLRDDNLLVDAAGKVWICDWNWPVLGADWLDTLFLLIGPRGDGLDVDAILRSRALTREVPEEHVDICLALVTGYFFKSSGDPVPPASPHLRDYQAWQGDVCWQWLCERRGWT